jgi:membrane associated rhomboid family serine protease
MRGNSILNDLRSTFSRDNNSLNQLILVNVLVFLVLSVVAVIVALFQLEAGWYLRISRYLAVPASLGNLLYRPWSLFTYMFVHAGFFHILFNMLWLYWIGQIFQEYLGSKKLVAVYFLGGLAGAFMYILAFNIFPLFRSNLDTSFAVGASASVLAVVVGAATLLPNFTIRLFLFGNVPLKYLALAMVIIDLLSASGSNAGGHFAHLGGAVFGFVYIKQLQAGRDLGSGFNRMADWLVTTFKPSKKSRLKVSYRNPNPSKEATVKTTATSTAAATHPKVQQESIDRILDKIAQKGYDGLSKEEKEQLFRASKQ